MTIESPIMSNDTPPQRRRHPLEERETVPTPPTDPEGAAAPRGNTRVMLHLPSVTPYVCYVIIALNIVIFSARALSVDLNWELFLWGANHPPAVLENGELYRLFTSMFLHASIYTPDGAWALANSLHLIFNMTILYYAGTQLERIYGHVRFSIIYLLGGLGGSILSTVLSDSSVYSVGASGAVFAILGAQFVYLYQHRRLLGAWGRAQMRSLLSLGLINLVFGLLSTAQGAALRIDNWGHLGGVIGGVALAFAIGPYFIPQRHPDVPNALLGVDINPLKNRYWALSAYAIALMAILLVARIV